MLTTLFYGIHLLALN